MSIWQVDKGCLPVLLYKATNKLEFNQENENHILLQTNTMIFAFCLRGYSIDDAGSKGVT